MTRDFSRFPADDNGEVLWRLVQAGDDLSVPRDVEFVLDFDSEQGAVDCGIFLFRNEYKVQLSPPLESDADSPWSVEVIPYMAPDYRDIAGLEAYLKDVAQHFGGVTSGWGCIAAGQRGGD